MKAYQIEMSKKEWERISCEEKKIVGDKMFLWEYIIGIGPCFVTVKLRKGVQK